MPMRIQNHRGRYGHSERDGSNVLMVSDGKGGESR
nr:MAG TPA: hypothetical protein [Caudoviricetes sp.]